MSFGRGLTMPALMLPTLTSVLRELTFGSRYLNVGSNTPNKRNDLLLTLILAQTVQVLDLGRSY